MVLSSLAFWTFYSLSTLINTQTGPCHPTCATCQTQEDPAKCLTCTSNFLLQSTPPSQCTCGLKRFFNENTQKCESCPSSCRSCSYPGSQFSCTSCEQGATLQPDGSCKCQSQSSFMDGVTGACRGCHYSCQTCIDETETGCTSCDALANLSGGKCTCSSGYSMDPASRACVACYSTCKQCQGGLAISCTECYPGMNQIPVFGVPTFSCSCPNGQFYVAPSTCVSCGGQCKSCIGNQPNQCLTCYDNAYLTPDNTCQCNFPLTWSTSTRACEQYTSACHSYCLTCFGPNYNQCLTCKQNAALTEDNSCACLDGWTLITSDGSCAACDSKCKTCLKNQPATCTSCNSNLPVLMMEPTGMKCLCNNDNPLLGKYFNIGTSGCTDCSAGCRTCDIGTACLSCSTPSYKTVNLCTKLTLHVCPEYCIDCSANPSICTQCKSFSTLNSATGKCECVDGFSMIGGVCIMCQVPGCKKCPRGLSTCDECNSITEFNLVNEHCLCANSKYLLDLTDHTCKSCHMWSCDTCNGFGPNNCLTCPQNTVLTYVSATENYCDSLENTYWHPNLNIFNLCHPSCKNCVGELDTYCRECKSSLAILSSEGRCVCPFTHYLDAVDGECKLCHSTCKKCNGPAINQCTMCNSGATLDPTTNKCICNTGSTMSVNGICSVCHKSCLTCEVNSILDTSCLSCRANTLALASFPGQCLCVVGYYMDINGDCQRCHFSCNSCFGEGQYGCLDPKDTSSNLKNFTTINKYACVAGYYMDSQGICQVCDPSCKTCSGPLPTNCTSCKNSIGFTFLTNGQCLCYSGGGFVMYQGECKECGRRCSSCNAPNDNNGCTACKIYAELSGSTCTCISGFQFYSSGVGNDCSRSNNEGECALSCDDCTAPYNEAFCTSCPPFATLSGGFCTCIANYGRVLGTRCGPCSPKCATCNPGSFTTCTSCSCSNCDTTCTCNQGYYMTYHDKQCKPCHSTCLTCDGPGMDNCLSCATNGTMTLSFGHCVCASTGQFMAVSGSSYYCQTCDSSCARCATKPDLCLQCASIQQLAMNRYKCDCPRGQSFSMNMCVLVTCHSTCMAPDYCNSISSAGCLKCPVGAYMYSSGTCSRIDGYANAASVTTLASCHFSCLSCTTADSSGCLDCKRNAISPAANYGVCSCSMGMVSSTLPATLGDCMHNCNILDCTMCIGGAGTCSACKGELILSGNQCLCPLGKYRVGLGILCRSCHQSCYTCTGPSKTSCVACKPGLSLVGSECKCGSGKYMDSKGDCKSCHITCTECVNGLPNGCITCAPTRQQLASPDNTCRLVADNTLYCYPNCATCDGVTYYDCLTCPPGLVRKSPAAPKSECECTDTKSYFDIQSKSCALCHTSCLTCSGPSSTECTSCTAPAALNSRGACICALNTQVDSSNPTAPCIIVPNPDPSCLTFRGPLATDCLTCKPPALKDANQFCRCPTGFYFDSNYNCQPCDKCCSRCTSGAANSCTQCKPGLHLDVDGLCKCPIGTQFASDGTCATIPCHFTCQKCTTASSTGCTECKQGCYLSGSTCLSLPGFFIQDGIVCSACSPTCKSCVSFGADNCIECKSFSTVIDGYCVCMMGYFQSGSSCQPCSSTCLSCKDSSTLCTRCREGARLVGSSCVLEVPGTVFDSHGTVVQLGCPLQCSTCTQNSLPCLSCRPNAVLLPDGSCYCREGFKYNQQLGSCEVISCHISCQTCNGPEDTACTNCRKGSTLNTDRQNPSNGTCSCSFGYGYNKNAECAPCHITCKSCSTVEECRLCKPGLKILPSGLCGCDSDYFLTVDLTCNPCDFTCLKCSGPSPTNCTSCKELALLNSTSLGTSCICPENFVRVTNGGCSFQSCDTQCLTCRDRGAKDCASCGPDAYLDNDGSCMCRAGVRPDLNGKCISCDKTCETCDAAIPNICTSCKSFSMLQLNGKCVCKSGMYFNPVTLQCSLCHYSCRDCTGPSDNQCTACKGSSETTLLSNGKCTCTQNMEISSEGFCSKCYFRCRTCDGAGNCASCGDGANLTSYKNCICPDNYFMNDDGNCRPCHVSCKTCSGSSQQECISCDDDRTLNMNNTCTCKEGRYLEPTTMQCRPCEVELNCKTCHFSDKCATCPDDYKLKNEGNKIFCKRIYRKSVLSYRFEIVHYQAIFYIETSADSKANLDYFKTIAHPDALSIVEYSATEATPRCISWSPVHPSEYEWRRGVLRFQLQFSDSCESFVGIVNLNAADPPSWKSGNSVPRTLSHSDKILQEVVHTSLTPENNLSKLYRIPAFVLDPPGLIVGWQTLICIISAPIYFVEVYLILVRPWIGSHRRSSRSMWFYHEVSAFKMFSLLGFTSVNLFGFLDSFMLTLAVHSVKILGIDFDLRMSSVQSTDYSNSHYLGKYTGSSLLPSISARLSLPIYSYLLSTTLELICLLYKRYVKNTKTCSSLCRCFSSMRDAIFKCYFVYFAYFASMNIYWYFNCNIQKSSIAILDLIFSISILTAIFLENSFQKYKFITNLCRVITSTKDSSESKNSEVDIEARQRDPSFPDTKDLSEFKITQRNSSEVLLSIPKRLKRTWDFGWVYLSESDLLCLSAVVLATTGTFPTLQAYSLFTLTAVLVLNNYCRDIWRVDNDRGVTVMRVVNIVFYSLVVLGVWGMNRIRPEVSTSVLTIISWVGVAIYFLGILSIVLAIFVRARSEYYATQQEVVLHITDILGEEKPLKIRKDNDLKRGPEANEILNMDLNETDRQTKLPKRVKVV
jgi:hypothetical protein